MVTDFLPFGRYIVLVSGVNCRLLFSSRMRLGVVPPIRHICGSIVTFLLIFMAVHDGLAALLAACPWIHVALSMAVGVFIII
jgi:threonine/homoserine/homoserine lactone efflux protein